MRMLLLAAPRSGSNYFVQLLAGNRTLLSPPRALSAAQSSPASPGGIGAAAAGGVDLVVVETATNDVADVGVGPDGGSVGAGDPAASARAVQVRRVEKITRTRRTRRKQ